MLKLESVEYVERLGTRLRWKISGLKLGRVNLIVGKNASGKTRTLNMITGIGNLVSGVHKMIFDSGGYVAVFDEGGRQTKYVLRYKDYKVIEETLAIDGKLRLKRGQGGIGKIFMTREGKDVDFQTPQDELALVARRDSLQHQFLEPLHQWGSGVVEYYFGKTLGQPLLLRGLAEKGNIDIKKTELEFLRIYESGRTELGPPFAKGIIKDMEVLGYNVKSMVVGIPDVRLGEEGGAPLRVMRVREAELNAPIDHQQLSQGMFRALSLLTQVNYCLLTKKASCIVVDDVGEGLDYERAKILVELLMKKSEEARVQLVMATNDRHIMNAVPLEAWSVIAREGWQCKVYNRENSADAFERFKSTGMSNFDFLACDYYSAKA